MRMVTLFLATSLTLASLGCDNMSETKPGTPPPPSGTTTTTPPSTTTHTTPSTTTTTPDASALPSATGTQPGAAGDKGVVDESGAVREVEPKPSEK